LSRIVYHDFEILTIDRKRETEKEAYQRKKSILDIGCTLIDV